MFIILDFMLSLWIQGLDQVHTPGLCEYITVAFWDERAGPSDKLRLIRCIYLQVPPGGGSLEEHLEPLNRNPGTMSNAATPRRRDANVPWLGLDEAYGSSGGDTQLQEGGLLLAVSSPFTL